MTSDTVPLRFASGPSLVRLRELTGRDERAVTGTSTSEAIALLDALLVEHAESSSVTSSSSASPYPRAEDMVAADRDRLLVAVYRAAFGDRIENTLTCGRCENRFDIDFSLDALVRSLETPDAATTVRTLEPNRFETTDGLRFRLPTGREERQFGLLPTNEAEQALRRCCLAEGEYAQVDTDTLENLLSDVAPLVDLELDARCPACGHAHALQFDIQSYLLSALLGERSRLAAEIHRLALAYGWSLSDILSLRRSERRHFVELIDNESSRHRRSPL